MKRCKLLRAVLACVGATLVCALPAHAELKILATVPEWGALARELGGEQVSVTEATSALQDPHRVEAKPTLIARARNADLVVATGAELEIGWLPLVVREAGNPRIQPGARGYFEAASAVRLLEVPQRVDRADGDVHAGGNPHIQLDPRNILKIAAPLAARLAELDPAHAAHYRDRLQRFEARWNAALTRWNAQAAPLRGVSILVHHKAFPYLEDWLGLREVGALEPKPGVEPGSAHLAAVVAGLKAQPARMVLRPAFQPEGPSRWVAQQAGIVAVVLPFTVGGTAQASDLFGLFDDTLARLLAALGPHA